MEEPRRTRVESPQGLEGERVYDDKDENPFHRKIQPDEFIDWLNTVERTFNYQDVPEDVKVKIVAIKLKRHAFVWWEQLKLRRAHENKSKIRTWEKMKRELQKKFLPDGFRKEIYDVLTLQPFISYNDVFKLATKIEKQLKEKETWKLTNYGFGRVSTYEYSTNRGSGSQSTKLATSKSSLTLPNQEGADGPSPSKSKAVQCFKCKGYGHISTDCTNKQIFTLVEEPIEEESQYFDLPPIFDEPSEQEDVIYRDIGELLVILRALAMDSIEDGVWLRHNIFHTRCTSLGKVCDVIIDSGSCENVVSKTMVKKLSLKTKKHPRPYKLYGRPWQFDRRTIHDGSKNTYFFDKDGGKIVLGPSKFNVMPQNAEFEEHHATIDCRSYRVIFGDIHAPEFIYHGSLPGKSMQIISALQARTLLSNGCEGFLATIHDTTSEVPSIHDQPIVLEFSDVFPDELLGIPPVREVEFNIELIPGSEPISKAPYRMAPIELKELKDQLQELLERGFIRPSVSP
uniref:CCHC-type domain-containing protein n=1 Tax=Tanacetum cinerariifolium TaxID=118510 RepID=A0A699HDQ3_TANCI|nr:hypothetical protein [Tanacetum cinerariifolium]